MLFVPVGNDDIDRAVEFPNTTVSSTPGRIEGMARYRLSSRLAGFKAMMLPGS
ncbi:hypothetical protein [Streptomyces sp. ISL-11]|uniref:hypothetical protein n=1 Tax=Streptomyces sp. ISL-11 TaxID=2819174 RepID=UPI001BEC2E97|nr:hypothetical protein [Streptomyces sp. ISL-11]MBT2385521.1 hypothetical protein [Streptomyces sp. ISL-11]